MNIDIAIAVWRISDGSNDRVQVSSSQSNGRVWSTPIFLSEIGQDAISPKVALNTKGKAVVVWTNDSSKVIQATFSQNGGKTWKFPAISISETGQPVYAPKVTINENDKAIIIWRRLDASSITRVQVASSQDGGATWALPMTLSDPAYNTYTPHVTMNVNGKNAIAVWRISDGSNDRIQAVLSDDNGKSWSAPFYLSELGKDAATPQAAINDDSIVVIWREFDGSNDIIKTTSSQNNGNTWSIPIPISHAGYNARNNQLSMNAKKVVAIWKQHDGVNDRVQVSSSRDGGISWSAPIFLSEEGENAAIPQISVNACDEAIAIWKQYDGVNDRIQASSSRDGGISWSIPIFLSAAEEDADDPFIVTNAEGNGIAIWSRFDGSGDVIQTASQIKVDASYKQEEFCFLLQQDIVDTLSWKDIPEAILYRIYTDKALTNLVYEGRARCFYQHGIDQNQANIYYIIWIDNKRNASFPTIVRTSY